MTSGLVSYSDSEEEDLIYPTVNQSESKSTLSNCQHESRGVEINPTKRRSDQTRPTVCSTDNKQSKKVKLRDDVGMLPLPDVIKEMYNVRGQQSKPVDDSSKHEGRIRSFAHEEGNWATHVSIKYNEDDRLTDLVEELLTCLRPCEFKPMAEHHISVSRTVTVRHHWIKSLTDSLREKLEKLQRCFCKITTMKLYTNEEKTRTFVAMEVISLPDNLRQYIQAVDDCFQDFKLQKYYTESSFHISVGWCLGNVLPEVTEQQRQKLDEILQTFMEDNPDMKIIEVDKVHCKIGNKTYIFPLSS